MYMSQQCQKVKRQDTGRELTNTFSVLTDVQICGICFATVIETNAFNKALLLIFKKINWLKKKLN